MLVSNTGAEIRMTIEAAVDLINTMDDDDQDIRAILRDHGFSRAESASAASIARLDGRLRDLRPVMERLPELDTADAAALVNEQLTELAIAPAIADHGGSGPHMHWTPATATFDDQVMADLVMAVGQELCESGTSRFGSCGADNCDDLFYDATRNRSRRFCSDPKCASRTHTADFRARRAGT